MAFGRHVEYIRTYVMIISFNTQRTKLFNARVPLHVTNQSIQLLR